MKYRIRAHRTAGSVFGAADSWAKTDGQIIEAEDRAALDVIVERWSASLRTPNVWYEVVEVPDDA